MSDAANGSAPLSRAAALLDRLENRVESGARDLRDRATASQTAPVSQQAAGAPSVNPAAERAGAMLDQAGERLGTLASEISLRARKALALAREEAEDMLAEAQAIRRGQAS